MSEPLNDPRVGTNAVGNQMRILPETDLMGNVLRDIPVEQGIGHGHFVVIPTAVADHLIAEQLAKVRRIVDAHYAPPPVELQVDAAEPDVAFDGEPSKRGSKGSK